jgi:glycosyltransferase involved in cell wall biosynthesis
MKIAFVWEFDKAKLVYPFWRDGLRAALEEISLSHKVDWYLGSRGRYLLVGGGKREKVPDDYDFILVWGDSTNWFTGNLENYSCRKGLCLTATPADFDSLRKYDVVYVESSVIEDELRPWGLTRIIRAFGTDTDFFIPSQEKRIIDGFYPATYSPWKRQNLFAGASKGSIAVSLGTVQPDGLKEYSACLQNSFYASTGYLPVETILDLYKRSKCVVITAVHGSERTVLEAMSMNIPVLVTKDNKKAASFILEAGDGLLAEPDIDDLKEKYQQARTMKVNTRPFVVAKYSHRCYAKALLEGIQTRC